ncbi:peptidylprolyl isomerase [Bartonella sp. TP]|uniref:peptidylprolyl isomerase n=1 Tax=Bartonella sp. TP TaxID=3057550 RepID=UPI0025AF04E2|nr:peptidylprolyl isomerase [Bartonella sp. TP]WJW79612.1 peptidylprolyl isomerase [Bartonella sp. TP]
MRLNYKMNKLLVSLLVSTALCGVGRVNAATMAAPVQAKAPVGASELEIKDSDVMAVIQGKAVTAHDLDVMAMNLDSNLMRLPVNKRRLATLRIYISMVALAHAAEQKGLAAGDKYQQMMSFARNEVLQKLYINQEIIGKISDADLKARYDKEVAATPKEEEVHARHIIVKTKPEAEAIIKRLEQGENFETIAKASSTDGSAAVGGDLGYFSHGQMVEPFEKAAFALKVGGYTHMPVQSPFGWHVIKLEDKRIKKLPAFEDMRENMRNLVASDRYKASIGDLRSKADIKIPNNAIAKELDKFDNMAAVNGSEDADEEAN